MKNVVYFLLAIALFSCKSKNNNTADLDINMDTVNDTCNSILKLINITDEEYVISDTSLYINIGKISSNPIFKNRKSNELLIYNSSKDIFNHVSSVLEGNFILVNDGFVILEDKYDDHSVFIIYQSDTIF